jgi:hypothetical protein
MNASHETSSVSTWRIIGVGFLLGLLLNNTGWLGNNFLLGSMWAEVGASIIDSPWRDSIWRDVFSFLPDFVYGFAIAYLCVALRPRFAGFVSASLPAGMLIAIVGGITTYFAIANSGFIPWKLAFASFALVLATKLPLAVLGGWMLEPKSKY